jgi:DNA-directed RNA polymerase subunit alpha
MDAIFSPVKNVSFRSENMRVGDRTDFDKLFLNIETDGTITPEEALGKASSILLQHFELIKGEFGVEQEKEEGEEEEEKEKKETKKKKKSSKKKTSKKKKKKIEIEDLKLPTKTVNLLNDNRVKTVAGLLRKTKESLLEIDGMGPGRIKKIEKALDSLGLSLKKE